MVSLPGLNGQSGNPGRALPDGAAKPDDDNLGAGQPDRKMREAGQ
jgi:hypothetical protein